MSLLFYDSFDHYTSVLDKWHTFSGAGTGGGAVDSSGIGAYGRRGSNGLRLRIATGITWGITHSVGRQFSPSGNTFIGAMAFTSVTPFSDLFIPASEAQILTILQGGTRQVVFFLNSNGTITASRYDHNNIFGTTSVPLVQGVTTHVEYKVVIANSGGSVVIRFNGTEVLNVSSVDTLQTSTATFDEVRLGPMTVNANVANSEWRFDDIVVLDGSGSAPWNNFLGDCRADVRLVTAEGAYSQWTPLTGTDNAAMVDEVPADGDTTYNSTATSGHKDSFVVEDVAVPGAALLGVQLAIYHRKADAGLCELSALVRRSSTDYTSVLPNPSTAYAYGLKVHQTDPGTSAQWAEADFNAIQVGYVRP